MFTFFEIVSPTHFVYHCSITRLKNLHALPSKRCHVQVFSLLHAMQTRWYEQICIELKNVHILKEVSTSASRSLSFKPAHFCISNPD